MKIRPTQPPQRVAAPERNDRRRTAGSQRAPSPAPATQVRRSSLMSALESPAPANIRPDLVAEMKAAIADGTFDAKVDIDTAIDSLLGDL